MAFSNDSLKEWDKKNPTKTNLKNQQIKKKNGLQNSWNSMHIRIPKPDDFLDIGADERRGVHTQSACAWSY